MHWYPAPAKLNLFLHVVGRRADGYHELQTVFRFLDHGDRLRIRVRDDARIVRVNDVARRAGRRRSVRARSAPAATSRRLPAGRGDRARQGPADGRRAGRRQLGRGHGADRAQSTLGTRSAGASSCVRSRLQLGADVPVFVFGENAFAEGIGERLDAHRACRPHGTSFWCRPSRCRPRAFSPIRELTRNTNRIKMSAFFAGAVGNDLEAVVCRRFPVVRQYLDWLKQHAPARLTGSGACVFASFDEEHAGARGVRVTAVAYARFRRARSGAASVARHDFGE